MNTAIKSRPSRSAATALLEAEDLPTEDLTDDHLRHFFYSGPASAPVGIVGVEFCGPHALLRSLVVQPGHRSGGLGAALVRHAERYAREHGARSMYLLTTTAERFFIRCGYLVADRANAPAEIRATREFSTLCPGSAAFLAKDLHKA